MTSRHPPLLGLALLLLAVGCESGPPVERVEPDGTPGAEVATDVDFPVRDGTPASDGSSDPADASGDDAPPRDPGRGPDAPDDPPPDDVHDAAEPDDADASGSSPDGSEPDDADAAAPDDTGTTDGGAGPDVLDTTDGGADDAGAPDGGSDAGADCPASLPTLVHDEGSIEEDTEWGQAVHVVEAVTFTIEEGTLRVDEPCSVVRMAEGSSITVKNGGGLELVGEPGAPVTLTAGAEDTPEPGGWNDLEIRDSADTASCRLEHAVVRYGGGGFGDAAVVVDDEASLAVTNSRIVDSEGVGLEVEMQGAVRSFEGNVIRDNAEGGVEIGANHAGELGPGTYGPNGGVNVRIREQDLVHDATWRDLGTPYVAEDGFEVAGADGSAVLTVEAGATVALGAFAEVTVAEQAGLSAEGSASAAVTFTAAASPPEPGDWDRIELEDGSLGAANLLRHTRVEYGGSGSLGQLRLEGDAAVTLDHATFADSDAGCDVDASEPGQVDATDSDYVPCD